jgi:hypothetical protein
LPCGVPTFGGTDRGDPVGADLDDRAATMSRSSPTLRRSCMPRRTTGCRDSGPRDAGRERERDEQDDHRGGRVVQRHNEEQRRPSGGSVSVDIFLLRRTGGSVHRWNMYWHRESAQRMKPEALCWTYNTASDCRKW